MQGLVTLFVYLFERFVAHERTVKHCANEEL